MARVGAGVGFAFALTITVFVVLNIACAPDKAQHGGRTGSVGALLAQDRRDGRLFVRDTPRGLAAARAGLQPEDEILLIDGRDVRRMSPGDIHTALEGEIGSTVRLTVWRRGEVERLTLIRSALEPQAPPTTSARQ